MWYKNINNVFFTDEDRNMIEETFGHKSFENLIAMGFIKEVPNPTVIDILKGTGSVAFAAKRYQDIHKTGIKTAIAMTDKINNDLRNHDKKKNKKGGKKRHNAS